MTKLKNIKVYLNSYIDDDSLENIMKEANERGILYSDVYIGHREDYDGYVITSYYYREENDQEYATRLAQEKKYNDLKKEREYQDYIKLKAQFERK